MYIYFTFIIEANIDNYVAHSQLTIVCLSS